MHVIHEIHWGDAPTWIAAVAAVVAGVFTALTLVSQRKQLNEQREFIREQSINLDLERKGLRAAAVERRERQARQVEVTAKLNNPLGGDPEHAHRVVLVRNNSSEPIHNVRVIFGESLEPLKAGVLTRFEGVLEGQVPVPVATAKPGAGYDFTLNGVEQAVLLASKPRVQFRDNAGVSWEVDEHNSLREVGAEPSGA